MQSLKVMRCLTGNQCRSHSKFFYMTDGIELSGADSQSGGGVLGSLQPLHQLICDADQSAFAVVQPLADKRLDERP